jgi:hypothetical protein
MGQYTDKKLIIPANIAKLISTSSVPTAGRRKTYGGPGNEGIDVAEWLQDQIDDGTIIVEGSGITNLVTLTGRPAESTDLGTFAGSIITDNTTIVNALQELETYIADFVSGGDGIYGGSGTVPTAITATLTDTLSITTTNTSGAFLANVGDLSGANVLVTNNLAKIKYYDLAGTNEVIANSSGISINTLTPDRLTITGLDARYAANYHAYYDLRSLVDKEYVDSLHVPIEVGDGIIGDGTVGNPLEWAGGWTLAPITGSGTQFFPFTIANNSITTQHIQAATILFSDWNQNSAILNQVPLWNGSAWVASSIVTLPAGAMGEMMIHNGTSWISRQPVTETKTSITGTSFSIASTPVNYAPYTLYKNGVYQVLTDDYTFSGTSVTMVYPLVSTDKVTIIYFI